MLPEEKHTPCEIQGMEDYLTAIIDQYSKEGKELPTFSHDTAEALYAFAYGFYENGIYDKAVHFFRFLTLMQMNNKKYWMGLGASYHMLKDYECALQCYGYAAFLDENDPYVHLHAAECFFALDEITQGQQALSSAETLASSQPKEGKKLLSRIKLMKKKNQKQKSKKG